MIPLDTLADYAEAWMRETNRPVPSRDTPAWQSAYEEWINYAFGPA